MILLWSPLIWESDMSHTNRHYHIALGDQEKNFFRMIKFDTAPEAANFFLNLSSEIFDSFKKSDRITIENNLYQALERTNQTMFDGGNKLISLIFGCESINCMLSTYN